MALGLVTEQDVLCTVGGAEVTVGGVTDTTNGIFVVCADLNALVASDNVEFRAYTKVRGNATERVGAAVITYNGAQTPPNKMDVFGPIAAGVAVRITVKQTAAGAGGAKTMPVSVWKVG